MTRRPAVFFDRDGIVNRRPTVTRYVERPEDFHLVPEFIDALRLARARGYVAVLVTNQRGVGLGVMPQAALDDLHARLERHLAARGLGFDSMRVCTAVDDSHPDRKPNPGMLLGAARDLDLDLERSWMIGDTETDIEAGRRAGCKTIRVSARDEPTAADYHVSDMAALGPLLDRVLPSVLPSREGFYHVAGKGQHGSSRTR